MNGNEGNMYFLDGSEGIAIAFSGNEGILSRSINRWNVVVKF
jgi:hypothetical protein